MDARTPPPHPAPPPAGRLAPADPLALAVALLVAVVVGLPHILFRLDPRHPGGDLLFLGAPDEEMYAARVKEVMEGRPHLGQTYFHEGKDLHPILPDLNERVLGTLARATGMSVPGLFTALDFLLPAAGAWLLFRAGFALSSDRGFGALLACGVCLSSFPWPQALLIGLYGWDADPWKFLLYYRSPHNQLSLLLLAPILGLAFRHLGQGGPAPRPLAALGLLLGLLTSVYWYMAMFAAVAVAAAGLANAPGRWGSAAREALWIAAGGALPAAAFGWHAYGAWTSGGLAMLAERGYPPEGSPWNVPESIVLLTAVHALLRRDAVPCRRFLLALGIGALVLANKGVLLPLADFQDRLHAVFWLGFVGTLLAVGLVHALARRLGLGPRAWAALAAGGCLLLAANGAFEQTWRCRQAAARYLRLAEYRDALRWLDENSPEASVVLASEAVAEVVPILTRHDIYGGCRYQAFYATDSAELERRFFEYHALWGVGAEEMDRRLAQSGHALLQPLSGSRPYLLRAAGKLDAYRLDVSRRYREFLALTTSPPAPSFRLDYVLVGPLEREEFPEWSRAMGGRERAAAIGPVEILRWR